MTAHLLRPALLVIFALLGVEPEHGPGLSLRIADEAAPAGSTVQIKVEVTEPKPISSGRGHVRPKGVKNVQGIVLMNEGQDTYGVALVNGADVTFDIVSPSSIFGTPADYPILGVAGDVRDDASMGESFQLGLDPSGFRDPSGAPYPLEVEPGRLTINNGVAIGDVHPGSAVVPAGGVVRISGANFTPTTRIQINEAAIREQRFVNSRRIDVVLAQATRMHGRRIRARNDEDDDRSESEYFSYERTTAIGTSNDAIFAKAVPLFAPATYTDATVTLPRRASRRRRAAGPVGPSQPPTTTFAFALQNLESSSATATIELLDFAGHPYAVNTVSVGPNQYLVREIGEVFGIVPRPSAFRVRSPVPLQVLGLVADHANGTAAALPPG